MIRCAFLSFHTLLQQVTEYYPMLIDPVTLGVMALDVMSS